jgi:hypothetical protein
MEAKECHQDETSQDGDLFNRQAGVSIGMRWMKCPRTDTRASSGSPPQSGLVLVHSDLHECLDGR